jgi:hypothetical protein
VEPDIWMLKLDDMYKYVAVDVDDQAIAMNNPKEFSTSWRRNASSRQRELAQLAST